MSWNLTEGFIASIERGQKVEKPVVQLLDFEKVDSDEDEERYRVIISDGIYNTSALLARRFNQSIVSGELLKFTIVSLDQYTLIEGPHGSADELRKVILILNMAIIASGREVRQKIGQPILFEENDNAIQEPSVRQSSNENVTTIEELVEMDYVPLKPCNDQNKNDVKEVSSCVIKMRGLPWSVTPDDIISFLADCEIKDGINGIHLTMSVLGRPSGEAYIELASLEDAAKALKKDLEHMGHRYVEVFSVTRSEMEWAVSHCGMNLDSVMDERCVRIRGLPYGCTEKEVASFFSGLRIVQNGIYFAADHNGRTTGEAYIQFVNKENLEKALQKHMENMGHRYIEVFRSSFAEFKAQTGPKMRPSVTRVGRTTPYNPSERFGRLNRFGDVGRPARRMSQYRNGNYWDDSGVGDSWVGSVPQNKPPMRGGFKRAGDSDFGPLHLVHMRGLPYKATETDIAMFFSPSRPINIRIIYDQTNRPSGEATVSFASHDEALEAMMKDKKHIQDRYIDLRLDSVPICENQFNVQSNEGGPVFKVPFAPRSRGGRFRGGQTNNRARIGGAAFGYKRRAGQGRQLFVSSSGSI